MKGIFEIRISFILSRSEDFSPEDTKQMMICLSFSYSITIYFYPRQNLHRDNVSELKWDQRRVKWKVIELVRLQAYLSTVCILSSSLAHVLFPSYTCFCWVTFNQAQKNTGVGLIPFLLISDWRSSAKRVIAKNWFMSLSEKSDSLEFVIHRVSSFLLIFQGHKSTELLWGGGWGEHSLLLPRRQGLAVGHTGCPDQGMRGLRSCWRRYWAQVPHGALHRGQDSSVWPPTQHHRGSPCWVTWKSSKSYFIEAS